MKKSFLLIIVLALVTKTFSQDYYQKSKNQKTTAWILLGTGTAAVIGGLIVRGNAQSSDDLGGAINSAVNETSGNALLILGGAACVVSIPFFINASKNQRLAGEVQISDRRVALAQKKSIVQRYVPGLTIKIHF